LTKKNSAQNKKTPPFSKKKKLPPIFISLKVALGAQEAPQKKLELSIIGKAKIIQGFLKGPPCASALLSELKFPASLVYDV
jgi:hypothetical protein